MPKQHSMTEVKKVLLKKNHFLPSIAYNWVEHAKLVEYLSEIVSLVVGDWRDIHSDSNYSVTRMGDLLDFRQLFKAFNTN